MVNVIGLGYIGLPTALMLAAHGNQVVGTDLNAALVNKLAAGELTFEEKGLDKLFEDALAGGIRFSTEYQRADFYIVSVPTPYDKHSKKADASYVVAAVNMLLEVAPPEAIVIIESTISPGTIDREVRPLLKGKPLHLAHAPERIIPGNMIYELLHNNRTVGADNLEKGEKIKQLYATFCQGEITITDIRTAEMTKVVENAYRAVNIAFANELSRICHYDNLDCANIIRICNKHPRVNILNPGPGVGGHCISVDPWFLVGDYPQLTKVIGASMFTNESQPVFVLRRIREVMAEHGITHPDRVGLYGITYKENVDDCRESPTLQLHEAQARSLGAPLKCYDPFFEHRAVCENQVLNFDEFLEGTDLIVIMVKHDHITHHWHRLKGKAILDCHHFCPLTENVHFL